MKTLLRWTSAALLLIGEQQVQAVTLNQLTTKDVYPFYAYAEMETEDSEAKKAEKAAVRAEEAKVQAVQDKKDAYKTAVATFSKSLTQADYDAFEKMKDELMENDGMAKEDFDRVKVSTGSLYKKHFSFPEVSRNDFAAEQLDTLEIAEKNFNADLDNKDLLKTFLATAASVKDKLKSKYADQWTDPATGEVPAEIANDD